jgi:hypothetical protein
MKLMHTLMFLLFISIAAPTWALSSSHPANPETPVPAFQPVDFFADHSPLVKVVETEHAAHKHEAGAADSTAVPEAESKSCPRDGRCCCCKCCGNEMMEESESSGMKGCGMMKQEMKQEQLQPAGKDAGHESHH